MTTEAATAKRWVFDNGTASADIYRPDGEAVFEACRTGGCISDPWGYPYHGHEKDGQHIVNCCNAIETAATSLGIDPGALAERLANGGIAGVVTAAVWYRDRLRKDIGFDGDGPVTDGPDMVELENVVDALRPFVKEQP